MDLPTPTAPNPARRPRAVAGPRDPLAVAIANASLMSAGYLMLRRRKLAARTGVITLVLITLLASLVRSLWFEILVMLWWAGLIAHGWYLAGGRARRVTAHGQRLVALAITIPVLLAVGLLRFDASRIEQAVIDARDDGDCAQAATALDQVWLGHRVADAPLTARVDQTGEACQRLRAARDKLAFAEQTGDTEALAAGYDGLASVLTELPGHEKMVDTVLDRFLNGLPIKNYPCQTFAVADWLRSSLVAARNNTLHRSTDVGARMAPVALLACGDALLADKKWAQAQERYQQLLQLFGDHEELKTKAQQGIELANVRRLLDDRAGPQPAYCATPAGYSGAAPYGKGPPNRAFFSGDDPYTGLLPGDWRTTDVRQAVLVICVGEKTFGASVRTCPYREEGSGAPLDVEFHKVALPVKAYELRTGRLVADTTVEIGGASCPDEVTTYRHVLPLVSPSEGEYVTPAEADVRAAFQPLITP